MKRTARIVFNIFSFITSSHKKKLFILLVLMVFSSFLEVISIGALFPMLTALTSPEKLNHLFMVEDIFGRMTQDQAILSMSLLFVFAFSLAAIVRMTLLYIQINLSMAIGVDLCTKVYNFTINSSYEDIIQKSSSVLISNSQKARDLVSTLIQPTLIIISSSILCFVIVFGMFLLSPAVTLLTLFFYVLLYILIFYGVRKKLSHNAVSYADQMVRSNQLMQEGIGGIREVKLNAHEGTYVELFQSGLSKMQEAAAGNALISQMPRFFIETVSVCILAVSIAVLSSNNISFVDIIPILGVIALAAQRMLPVFQQAYAAVSSIQGSLKSTQDVIYVLKSSSEADQRVVPKTKFSFVDEIEFVNVSYTYPARGSETLKEINLVLRKGEHIGVVGPSGSGKSTLIDVLMGLLEPTTGSVLVDKIPLSQLNYVGWQSLIAHVSQDIFISQATLIENIAFGRFGTEIDRARAIRCAELAGLEASIDLLPLTYETPLGERGINLSGGQRQRIGIARALYKEAELIVLDEATSSLDNDTESKIISEIYSTFSDKTIISIAHRLSSLKNCDRIITVENGYIESIYDYKSLINNLEKK